MRYHELLETTSERRPPERPLIQPQPFRADVKLVIRFMPAVYRWIDLKLGHGGPDANISIHSAQVRFPEPYDADGALSSHCRQWILEMVRNEVERLGLSICIVFGPEDAVALWPGRELVVSTKPPEGGLLI
jgi:hypothetical protein